ncbi:MAG: hypothetical protein GX028_03985 [Clostridiaceae bacterium]|nr:hypothetical protein [Clostridiaceae bacterium]
MRKLIIGLHLFIGIGALFGGSMAMLFPEAPMGIDISTMPNMPFASFFIPGLLLFAVMGLGNLVAAIMNWKKSWLSGYATGVTGGALVVWIIVQCFMISAIEVLHIIFFALGAVQGLLALIQLHKQRLFPFNSINI